MRALNLWFALRRTSAMDLAICALMALAAAVFLGELAGHGSELSIGILFGLGTGLGAMALALWGRRRRFG